VGQLDGPWAGRSTFFRERPVEEGKVTQEDPPLKHIRAEATAWDHRCLLERRGETGKPWFVAWAAVMLS